MVKQRRESSTTYEEAGRLDLAQQEQDEIVIIETFLPQQMSDDEVVSAVKEVGVSVPVVVRLEGTNVDKGRELLASSGLDIIAAEDLTDAAKKVVAAAA